MFATLVIYKNYTGKDWPQILIGHTDELMKSRILLLLWRSWHLRNDIIHADGKETIARSVAFLMSYACEQTTESTIEPLDGKGKAPMFPTIDPKPSPSSRKSTWCAPPPGWIKITSDASFIGRNQPGGAGAVARDDKGSVIIAACSPIRCCKNAEDAEAQAALLAVKMMSGMGYTQIILEMDCTTAVSALQAAGPDRSES
jgi:hypothetical protein